MTAERLPRRRKQVDEQGRPISRRARYEPVWQGNGEAAAAIIAGGLQADGIRARMQGGRPTANTLTHAFARDTWAVFVHCRDAARARELLYEQEEGPNVIEGEDPEAFAANQRATLKFAVFAVLGGIVWLLWMSIRAEW
jgi:hypothetical protein